MIQGKKMYCDLCGKEIVRTCEANQARPLTIKTETACTNPMARHSPGFQENTAHYDDLCYDCQRGAAAGIAKVLDNLKSNSEKNDLIDKLKDHTEHFHIYTFGGLKETNKWLKDNNYA
mgnify:CR=1 FL=1